MAYNLNAKTGNIKYYFNLILALFPACRSTLKIIYHGTQALEKKSEVFLLKFKIKFYIILTELSSLFEMKVNLELESFA